MSLGGQPQGNLIVPIEKAKALACLLKHEV